MAICCTPRTLNGRNVEDNARAGAARTRMAVLRMLMRGYCTDAIGKDCAHFRRRMNSNAADEQRTAAAPVAYAYYRKNTLIIDHPPKKKVNNSQ